MDVAWGKKVNYNKPYRPPTEVPEGLVPIPGYEGFYFAEAASEVWRYRDRTWYIYGKEYPAGWHEVRSYLVSYIGKKALSHFKISALIHKTTMPEEDDSE